MKATSSSGHLIKNPSGLIIEDTPGKALSTCNVWASSHEVLLLGGPEELWRMKNFCFDKKDFFFSFQRSWCDFGGIDVRLGKFERTFWMYQYFWRCRGVELNEGD